MKILIVEGNDPMREMIRSLVGDLADEVRDCRYCSEAFAAFEEYRPDWVLMDISMKDGKGAAAAERIKNKYPGARVVIFGDYEDAELGEVARKAGACAYVVTENLLEVRRIIGARQ